ncbi:MAG: glycosyltransferase family 39 protein, partial [Anaerolineales bacterium]
MTDSVSQREPAPPEAEASAFPAPDPPKSITPVEPSALPAVPAPLQSAVSHVQLAFDLAPGARIRITIEDLGPDGHDPSGPATIIHQVVVDPAQAQSVRQTEPVALLTVAPAVVQPVPTAVTLQVTPATPPARAWPPYAEHIRQRLSGWFETGAWRAYLRAALDAQMRDQPLMMALFWLSLGVYTITRFTGLNQFPLYFFSDEAVQTVLAADFVRDGFRDFMGRYFPTYFQNGTYFNLSASVYLQIIPYALFGRSVWVTRGVSVLVALFGAAGVGLALKNIFNVRWWWAGVLLLSITPAWFLHSRTAFETVLMASFYVWFLYFYWLYRLREPRYLFPALFFGALAFYSYKGGQIVVVLTGFCLLLSDLRYHWANRRVGWWGIVFLLVLMLPFLRFVREQPNETFIHLRTLDSYWVNRDLTFPQKLAKFWKEYTFGLSPGYWYFPTNHRDLVRHLMKGYGHILLPTLPLAALGVLVCLRRITSPTHRALLLALLVAPAGGVLAEVGITRVLVFVIPVALLTALGLEMFWEWLPRQWTTAAAPALGAFALLSVVNFGMLRDALVNGPTWYHDYGLGGMQYGAQQVYAEIKDYLRESPQTEVILTPVWTNGADYLQRFFVPDELRVR